MSSNAGKYWTASWNPITGCKPDFPCWERCWAREMVGRFNVLDDFNDFEPTYHYDRITKAPYGKGKYVATCWLGDMFAREADDRTVHVFETMVEHPQHAFLILTKRAQEMYMFLCHWTPAPNIWLGISASTQAELDERLPWLLKTPAAVRWVSLEPLLEKVAFASVPKFCIPITEPYSPSVGWVVLGAELGNRARAMELGWARSIRDECLEAAVPFWLKSLGPRKGRTLDSVEHNGRPEIGKKGGD